MGLPERSVRGLLAVTVAVAVSALTAALLTAVPASAGGPNPLTAQVVPQRLAAGPNTWHPQDVGDDASTGEVYLGLRRSAGCPGGFEVESAAAAGRACSHGPDPAPLGVDVQDVPTVAELGAQAAETQTTALAGTTVPCYGDGTSGNRVQAIYAVASDRTDRYSSVVDLIRGYAAVADQAFAGSAARNGGVRHIRWVTDSGCRVAVDHVVLSPTGDDSIANTRTELRALGHTSNDRKYIVFADAGVYCGIAYTSGDSRPDASNPANSGATVARVDTSCWGGTASVPAHEIAHTLGAVQLQAPHSNGAWHCTDEYDRLCYNDGSGATLTYLCASSQEPLLDCNGDDYFNVSPAPGSWLATHWNLASSAFLESIEPAAPPSSSSPAPLPTTSSGAVVTAAPTSTLTASPVAPPPGTVTPTASSPVTTPAAPTRITSTWHGRLTADARSRSYRLPVGRGTASVRLWFRGADRLRVTVVRRSTGEVLVGRRGRSVLTAGHWLPAGTYRVTVRGPERTRFRLALTHVAT